ncbi:hypothetical protein BCR24_13320 [Enterococcus ureilyticus]|uniref:Radical SAM core domain-containing protein n=1 Tax=Enterococcus ureilyticus TaxID=1131292 RepID=A0A1E5HE50_9ENTE|nr:radical SAM protein [Enterococcus ureilyticus]MBM7689866.1 uncharacterized protein [Enterococcus ureilyticus]OEG23126.1 hypothetical protein BCR24_13320 [Enterococcus ureilyticus]
MKVHFIENTKHCGEKIAFLPDTQRFFKVNLTGEHLIKDIENSVTKDEIFSKYPITEKQYFQYYNIFSEEKEEAQNPLHLDINEFETLNRLVLHMTNDCNLRCTYCYANGGNYHSDRTFLKRDILDDTLELFYSSFQNIQYIQFFGGEPLLNISMIEYTCKKVEEYCKFREIKTQFGVVTNGTIMTKKFIDLVKKYNIAVTVSYDGEPKVNDIMRFDKHGRGTSKRILKNISKLNQYTNQPSTIEVTYNQNHVENDVSIQDVVDHISEEVPNAYIHLVPAGATDEEDYGVKDLSIFPENLNNLVEKHLVNNPKERDLPASYSLVDRIVKGLINGPQNIPLICDAGLGTISVSVNGDVYPCFMFTDQEKMKYGNIYSPNLFKSEAFNSLQSKIHSFSIKNNNKKCKDCFIKNLCNGCLGLNSFHSGDPFRLSEMTCDMFKKMTEEAIIVLANQ